MYERDAIRNAIARKMLDPKPLTTILGEPCMYAVEILNLLAVHQEMPYPLDQLAKKSGVGIDVCEAVVKHLVKEGLITKHKEEYGLYPETPRQKALIYFIKTFYDDLLDKRKKEL